MEILGNDFGNQVNHFTEDFFRDYAKKFNQVIVDLFAKYSNDKRDLKEVKDILQESIIICYQKRNDPDFVLKESEEKYFYGIARNLVMQYLKRKNRLKIIDLVDDQFVETEPLAIKNRMSELVLKCLELLKGSKKDILTLKYFHGHSSKQIAQMLHLANEDVVKSTAYRAKNEMYDCLESNRSKYE